MDKLAEDIKFGLTHEFAFFSPKNMGRTARALAEMGYKNTEVIDAWLKCLHKKLTEDGTTQYTTPPTYEQVVYGSMKGMAPRYYVFQGFQDSVEFNDHLQTLMMFKTEPLVSKSEDVEARDTENAMFKLIEAATELKEVQQEQQAVIETLREQFFKLQQAQNKHEFLQSNKYLVYDMLELQEMLVRGGYMDPNEALLGVSDNIEHRMERASQLFYDLVVNQQPDLLSPQYDQFYDAATRGNQRPPTDMLTENHNDLTLRYISDSLVGLAEQAQAARRDACDKDYPNEHYERLLVPEEIYVHNKDASPEKTAQAKFKTEFVLMEHSYLNAWTNFAKSSTTIVNKYFRELINKENTADGLLCGLRALSACKFQAVKMRKDIVNKLLERQDQTVSVQPGIDGLYGMAQCSYHSQNQATIVDHVMQRLEHKHFTFYQKCDLLHAIALLASHEPTLVKHALFTRVLKEVDELVYEGIDNDLTHKQFALLQDVHETLVRLKQPTFQNKILGSALKDRYFANRFGEALAATYDPLKNKVVSALSRALTDGDTSQVLRQQQWGEFAMDMIVKPDILTGLNGEKVGIHVLNDRESMRDSHDPDGRTAHFLRLNSEVTPVTVAIAQIVDYDLQSFKLKMKNSFSLTSLIPGKQNNEAYTAFARFASQLTRNMDQSQISGNCDLFLEQLAECFRLHSRLETQHETEMLIAANDALKIALIKLQMIHNAKLSKSEQMLVRAASGSSFDKLIADMRAEAASKQKAWEQREKPIELSSKFDFGWQGTRQAVELPTQDSKVRKAIEPELLSSKWQQYGQYHHYGDWKQMMQACYD